MTERADRLLSVDQAAELLNVKRQTLYNWVHQKRIPHVKLSRSVLRFDEGEVRRWLAAHAVPVKGEDNPEE